MADVASTGFGLSGTAQPNRPSVAAPATIGAGAAATYTFAYAQDNVKVNNALASTGTLRVTYGGEVASASVGQEVNPGDTYVLPKGKRYLTLSIYSSALVTYGTDFTIEGERR